VHWTDQVAPLGAGRAQAVAAERVTSGLSQPQLVQRQAGHAAGAAGEQAYGEGRRVARAVGQDDLTVEPAGRPILHYTETSAELASALRPPPADAGLAWLTGGWQRLARSSTCGAPACRRIVLITRPFVILRTASRPIGVTAQSWARRLTTLLPAMTLAEALETTRIHRVAGLTGARTAWVTTRPCRAPHHTLSDVGLIGGGHVPMPGDVSLAHHGVLFLDERPECRRHVLEVLRQPLEDGVIYRQSRGRPRPRRAGRISGTGCTVL
jgi:hypothetical protein